MGLTAKEQKRLKRLERVARQGRFVIYPLVAMSLFMLGMTLYAFLIGEQQCVVMLFFLMAGYILSLVLYLRHARIDLHIIKKLQGN